MFLTKAFLSSLFVVCPGNFHCHLSTPLHLPAASSSLAAFSSALVLLSFLWRLFILKDPHDVTCSRCPPTSHPQTKDCIHDSMSVVLIGSSSQYFCCGQKQNHQEHFSPKLLMCCWVKQLFYSPILLKNYSLLLFAFILSSCNINKTSQKCNSSSDRIKLTIEGHSSARRRRRLYNRWPSIIGC